MKTLDLSNTTKADDLAAIAIEACNLLLADAREDQDFDAYNEDIVEYDLLARQDPIIWSIDSVYWNEDGTASRVDLDC